MPQSSTVADLLLVWQERHKQGNDVSLEELCRECPDLLQSVRERVATLQSMSSVLESFSTISPTARNTTPSTAPLPEISGYEILEELGRGGMGVVYKARHLALSRLVALKLIRTPGSAGPEETARFQAEAVAVARMRHSNIVQIHDVGVHRGTPFIALEYVEGGSLDRKLAGRPLAIRLAAEVTETLARAMHYAHEQGVVHRDLKPANVLLDSRGNTAGIPFTGEGEDVAPASVKITDFGLAKFLAEEEDSGQTATGAIVGTPSYMAPEQASGAGGRIGPAADVYALGAILYELLTGRPPFRAETRWDTLAQVVGQEPVPPSRFRPKIATDLETICLHCLEKEPAKRYGDARLLAEDLRRFLDGLPTLARPAGRFERTVKWARRRPTLAALLLVSFLGALSLITLGIFYSLDLKNANENIRKERDLAQTAEKKTREQYEKTRRGLYDLQLSFVSGIYETDPERGLKMLLDEDRCPPELREFSWGLFFRLCRRDRLTLAAHDGQTRSLAVSRCGRFFASGGGDGKVKIWEMATGNQLASIDASSETVPAVAFDADSKTLATGGKDGRVRLWEVPSGKEIATLHTGEMSVASVAFSPRGSALAFGVWDGTVRVIPAPGDKPIVLPGASKTSAVLAFSPDGTELAATGDGLVRAWNSLTWKEKPDRKGPAGLVTALTYSPDGKLLACCDQNSKVTIWDTATGKERTVITVGSSFVFALAFTPDGMEIATGSLDGFVRVWDVATGLERVRFTGSQATVWGIAFTPDGKTLVSADQSGTIKLREMGRGFERRTLVRLPGNTASLVLSPDGTQLTVPGSAGAIRVLDIATGREINRWTAHQGVVTALAMTRDGKKLASAGSDGIVQLWDSGKVQKPVALKGHRDVIWFVAFSPDGQTLASAGQDGTLRLWDVITGIEKAVLTENDKAVLSVAFSPDGTLIGAGGADGIVRLWDIESGKVRTALPRRDRSVYAVAFAPDGATLATGDADGLIELWDLPTSKKRLTLRGHMNWVTSLAFSPNGQTLASGSRDGTLRLWDPVHGYERLRLAGHPEKVNAVAFAAASQVLAAAGPNQVRLWVPLFPGSP